MTNVPEPRVPVLGPSAPSSSDSGPQVASDREAPREQQEQGSGLEFGREEPVPVEVEGALGASAQIAHGVQVTERLESGMDDGTFVIESVTVSADSGSRVLKAACKSLGLSKSGGKGKLFGKTQSYFDQSVLS